MGYTLYDATVGNMIPGLEALSALLKKAESHATAKGTAVDSLVEARLYEDMLPFTFQVHVITDVAQKAVARIEGTEPADWSNDLKTVADCEARVEKTMAILKAASKDKVDSRADETVQMQLGKDKTITLPAGSYINAYSLPNFFFHLATAYCILRNQGVELGKMDYLAPFIGKFV